MAVQLNRQKLVAALTTGRKYHYLPLSLHLFDTVASTNLTAWDLLNQGAGAGTVVIATQQTAGRGQWGRQWRSQTGGLYLSLGITPNLEANASYQLTLAIAWGIAHQLRQCGVSVGIKWPNDLVLDGRKLGGILTETKVNQGKITQAVIGVGINWTNPVPETGINLVSWQANQFQIQNILRQGQPTKVKIKDSGLQGEDQCFASDSTWPISCLEMLTCNVLLGIESGMICLCQEGISILLSRYLELLVNMGDRVYVNNLAGTIVGVTPQGNLRVALETESINDIRTPEISLEPGKISLGYRKS